MRKRILRRICFDLFFREAKATFEALAASDPRHADLADIYGFVVTPGGAMGGHDDRLVEVFYGQRAFDAVRERKKLFDPVNKRVLAESGAALVYERGDDGMVLCTLHPAKTENMKRTEDLILLSMIRDVSSLTGTAVPARHWRYLMSYMQVTSLDGDPTLGDRFRIWRLMMTHKVVKGGVMQTPRWLVAGGQIVQFALTIGLSGFLLKLVEIWFASPAKP